jgi:tetratricopeptide (TPR) repeat protein
MKTIICGGLMLVLTAAMALAQTQKPEERFDNKVRDDFFAGMNGDGARFQRAMDACQEALQKDPKNAAAMVWYGAGLYVKAGMAFRTGNVQDGIALNQRALKEMADAVALEPESLQTRIPRAAILLGSARYMDESLARPTVEIAVQDYEKVFAIEKDSISKLPTHSAGELLGGLADGYRRLGNYDKSREYLERIVRDLPGTPYETQAKLWLANIQAVPRDGHFCIGCHMGSDF